MKSQHADLLETIDRNPEYTPEVEQRLRAAIETFKKTHSW
jgi:uncharacterized protein YeaC (DUF1315 family)